MMEIKIMKILFRLIELPFFSVIGLIAALRMWVVYTIAFARFGGEGLVYKKDHSAADILNFLEKKLNSEQNAQVSDTTEAASSTEDGNKK